MLNPKRVVRQGNMYCGDYVYGDYWEGPTRLSLLDSAQQLLIDTIGIQTTFHKPGIQEDTFRIPFFVPSGYYRVPRPNNKKEGVPQILYLRDLTGEQVAGQFVLFEYAACGIGLSSVSGYSPHADKAEQYPIETTEGKHKPYLSTWVPHVFGTKPIHPGYWRFTWEAGHGDWFWNHEEVSFDPNRGLFVRRLSRAPYPGFGEASCDLETKKLTRLLEALRPLFESGFTDSEIQDLQRLADTQPPDDNLLAMPLNTGRNLEMYMRKYKDGELGIWIVTEPELAKQIQTRMVEVE